MGSVLGFMDVGLRTILAQGETSWSRGPVGTWSKKVSVDPNPGVSSLLLRSSKAGSTPDWPPVCCQHCSLEHVCLDNLPVGIMLAPSCMYGGKNGLSSGPEAKAKAV